MKLKYYCIMSECHFSSETKIGLKRHYEQDHSLKERVEGSLVISGNEYLPFTNTLKKVDLWQ